MARPDDLPPELWKNILDYLDADRLKTVGRSELPQATPDITLRNLSLVSKFFRWNSLVVLFRFMQVQQYYSERKIRKGQDEVLTNCLEFIKRNRLQNHIICMSFRVILDEACIGTVDKLSANWLNDQKDWHIHRQTTRMFEVVNPRSFELLVYSKWKKNTTLVNALFLHQDVETSADWNIYRDNLLLHQKPWTEVQLLNVPQDQNSSIYYSMVEFNRRTPSLLKPLILDPPRHSAVGSYKPSRVKILSANTPKTGFPGLVTHLTRFTYLAIKTNQAYEDSAVASFLESNCPNLQHLSVDLNAKRAVHFSVHSYPQFTRAILAKPDLKTPKTFVGLDLAIIDETRHLSDAQNLLGRMLPEWKNVRPGEFHSFVNTI